MCFELEMISVFLLRGDSQAEGLMVELILSSCYDFVEKCCDVVLKALPVMQKLRCVCSYVQIAFKLYIRSRVSYRRLNHSQGCG